jgi:hypothetical protein
MVQLDSALHFFGALFYIGERYFEGAFFNSLCGLRHGDHFSPLMFVIVMEEPS